MIPTNVLANTQPALMAADTNFLAAATAMHVHPVINSFSPNRGLVIGDLVLGTFTGSAAKSAGTGAQSTFHDPLTNLNCIRILEPAGGWSWKCTATPGAPETVYGIAVTDTADAVLLGTQLLPTPVPIAAVNDGFSVAEITLSFLNNSPF